MAVHSTEERRRSRRVVLTALVLLVVIYFVKLTFPTTAYSSAASNLRSHTSQALEQIQQHLEAGARPVESATVTPTSAVAEAEASLRPSSTAHAVMALPTTSYEFADMTNGTIQDKVAIIIEDRPRTNLIPLILHFSTVLGPSWPIIIYTSNENVGTFASSAALGRYLRAGIISIRILPQTVLFTNSDSVSSFLTKRWLWDNLAPAKHVLLFQSDSMLCTNAARSVDDFVQYDFVGAPIAEHLGQGMNGGLSLRKRETMLRVLEEFDWEKADKGSRYEDRWYYDRFVELNARDKEAGKAEQIKLPSIEVARTFSVETIDFPHPLGVHQVHRWLDKQILDLSKWCPEYKLCSSDYIASEGYDGSKLEDGYVDPDTAAGKKTAAEEKKKADEAKQKADEEGKKVEEERKKNEEEHNKTEEERKKNEEERNKLEEERKKYEGEKQEFEDAQTRFAEEKAAFEEEKAVFEALRDGGREKKEEEEANKETTEEDATEEKVEKDEGEESEFKGFENFGFGRSGSGK